MRTSFVVALLCVVGLTVGVFAFLKGKSATPAPVPIVEVAADKEGTSPTERVVRREQPERPAPQTADAPTEVSSPTPTSPEPVAKAQAQSAPAPSRLSRAIDTLVSSEASFQEKQAALDQLYESRQLDAAIESLAQGAAEHPASAAYPAALGRVQLCKAGELSQSGGKISEMGMLGMQADENFDAAIEIDPTNWEAQFFKAAAMSHWPLELNKGNEVIQRLSSLIDQQGTMRPQPEFGQTYVMLGDQYQKMDQSDYALATWQVGAQKFPGDSTLQARIRAH